MLRRSEELAEKQFAHSHARLRAAVVARSHNVAELAGNSRDAMPFLYLSETELLTRSVHLPRALVSAFII